MTHVHIRYDNETNRVIQTYWADGEPSWANEPQDGTTLTTTHTTEQAQINAQEQAANSLEAGTDYDPETETVMAHLCYDPDSDALYAEPEVSPIET